MKNLGRVRNLARLDHLSLSKVPLMVEKPKFDFIFSFDHIILKLADKVDMDEVLDEFEHCLDQYIYFRVTPH